MSDIAKIELMTYRAWKKKSEEYKDKVVKSLLSCSKVCNGYKWWRDKTLHRWYK